MQAAEFISKTVAVRTAAHLAHLRTRSYSAHVALQAFYDGLADLIDDYAEVYQGLFTPLQKFPEQSVPMQDPLMFIVDYTDELRKGRADLAQGERALENIIDEIVALCGRTIYKLRDLK